MLLPPIKIICDIYLYADKPGLRIPEFTKPFYALKGAKNSLTDGVEGEGFIAQNTFRGTKKFFLKKIAERDKTFLITLRGLFSQELRCFVSP